MKNPENVKRGKRARLKGTTFERKIAIYLTQHTGLRWSRTPYSGASFIAGDVCVPGQTLPFVIELKNQEVINLNRLFKNPQTFNPLVGKDQILIFNNAGQSIAVIHFDICFPCGVNLITPFPDNYITCLIGGEVYIVMDISALAKILREVLCPIYTLPI